jgi:hypothetical protein
VAGGEWQVLEKQVGEVSLYGTMFCNMDYPLVGRFPRH